MLNALKLPVSPIPSLSLVEKSKALSSGIPFKKPSHSKQKVMYSCLFSSEAIRSYIDIKIVWISSRPGRNKCHALLQQNLNMFTYFTKYK